MKNNYDVYGKSDIGRRNIQEDSIYFSQNEKGYTFSLICDGMGGLGYGDKASLCVKNVFLNNLEHLDVNNPVKYLTTSLIEANLKVLEICDEHGNRIESGTTLVATLVRENELFYISVGDSRIYLFRKGTLNQLTTDQNYSLALNRMANAKEISQKEYLLKSRYSSALTNYVGMRNLSFAECSKNRPIYVEYGDKILLCSDGLYKYLSREQMETVFLDCDRVSCKGIVNRLLYEAENASLLQKRKQDNTSVIVFTQQKEGTNYG